MFYLPVITYKFLRVPTFTANAYAPDPTGGISDSGWHLLICSRARFGLKPNPKSLRGTRVSLIADPRRLSPCARARRVYVFIYIRARARVRYVARPAIKIFISETKSQAEQNRRHHPLPLPPPAPAPAGVRSHRVPVLGIVYASSFTAS